MSSGLGLSKAKPLVTVLPVALGGAICFFFFRCGWLSHESIETVEEETTEGARELAVLDRLLLTLSAVLELCVTSPSTTEGAFVLPLAGGWGDIWPSSNTEAKAEGEARAMTGLGWKIGSTGGTSSTSGTGDSGLTRDFSCPRLAFKASFDCFFSEEAEGGDEGDCGVFGGFAPIGTTSRRGIMFDRLGSVRLHRD